MLRSQLRRIHKDAWNAFISAREPVTIRVSNAPSETLRYAVKDNISTTEESTSCGSLMLADYKSPFDATVVSLLNDNGMKLVGKTNMDEFGMGSSTTNSYFGSTINPLSSHDDPLVSGGSSGGSAAAVAASFVDFSLGTDTGGSVRLPAAYCDIYGFKPTYGRISRWGVIPYAQSFDTVGILARSISTIEKVFGVLDKYDNKDPTSLSASIRERLSKDMADRKENLVIGIPQEFLITELAPSIRDKWSSVLENLMDLGHTVRTVSIPSIKKAIPAYYTLCTAEAASNLSRYDGIRYGHKKDILTSRSEGFGAEVQRRIILGNYTLSSSSGSHYSKATKIREQLVRELNGVFSKRNLLTDIGEQRENSEAGCDFMIIPTSVDSAPKIKEYGISVSEYLNDVYTLPASMAGLPAISVPVGEGIGLQVVGQWGDDAGVLRLASKLQ